MPGKHLSATDSDGAEAVPKTPQGPAAARRHTYHHGSVRDEARAVAHAMVLAQGGAAVSLREVAKALAVAPSALYRHYEDRAHLLSAVANSVHEELLAGLRSLRAGEPDARAAMASGSHHFLAFAQAQPALFRMMYDEEVIAHPKAAQWMPALKDTHAELLVMAAQAWPRLSEVALRERLIVYWSTLFGHAVVGSRGLLLAYMVEGVDPAAVTRQVVAAALGAFEDASSDDASKRC